MTPAEIKDLKNSDNLVLHYLVRAPKVPSSKKKAIILLHGVGSNEQDLFGLSEHLPTEFYIISPRGQFTLGLGRFGWYNVDFSSGSPVINAPEELLSRETIRKFISQVKEKYNLDEVYLGGFSQGAIMSFSVGLSYPKEVSGLICLSGRVLEGIQHSITKNEDLKSLKVFLAHGIQDGTLPVQYARQAKAFLQNLGLQLTYQEYNMGHQINGEILRDLDGWLK